MSARLDNLLWTGKQRNVLIIALFVFVATLTVRWTERPEALPRPLPAVGPRGGELQTRVDLNTVDAATLSAIPRLGEIKANAIVEYRTQFERSHPGHRAFETLDDLLSVKGVGIGTVAMLRPFVMIAPVTRAATRAATRPLARPAHG